MFYCQTAESQMLSPNAVAAAALADEEEGVRKDSNEESNLESQEKRRQELQRTLAKLVADSRRP